MFMFMFMSAASNNVRDFSLPHLCKWDLRFFWDVTQRRLIVIYRRFGTAYRRCVTSQKSKDLK